MDLATFDIEGFFAMISAILLLIITWYNKQRTEDNTVIANAVTATAKTNAVMAMTPVQTASIPVFDPGFTVTPASAEIKNGGTVLLAIIAGVSATKIVIDWGDGTVATRPMNGSLTISHTYNITVSDYHYPNHQFYPVFTLYDMYGQEKQFNNMANGQGSCCAILVNS
jgi:hypothetical protein